jgi:hypothetical protein
MTIRKTVEINDDLKAAIDALRKERGQSMKAVVNELLRLGLSDMEKNAPADAPRAAR